MKDRHMKMKTVTPLSGIIGRLEYLIESLRKGYLTVTARGKALILQPQEPIRLHMQAAVNNQKSGANQRLSIKLKWQRKSDAWRSIIPVSRQRSVPAPGNPGEPRTESLSVSDRDAPVELSADQARPEKKPKRSSHPRKTASVHLPKTRKKPNLIPGKQPGENRGNPSEGGEKHTTQRNRKTDGHF